MKQFFHPKSKNFHKVRHTQCALSCCKIMYFLLLLIAGYFSMKSIQLFTAKVSITRLSQFQHFKMNDFANILHRLLRFGFHFSFSVIKSQKLCHQVIKLMVDQLPLFSSDRLCRIVDPSFLRVLSKYLFSVLGLPDRDELESTNCRN